MNTISTLRPSPLAGRWYEGNPQSLARSVDAFLQQAELPELPGEVVAIVAPHAGHRYSGNVAGYAFSAVRGLQPEIVAVIAPMHHPYPQPLLTSAHDAYETPLGNVPVDREMVQALDRQLVERLGTGLAPVAYDQEHSLEIELPFLQRALGQGFRLLPVMIRHQTREISQAVGAALAETLKERAALMVASTDLSHFFRQEKALELDEEMLRRVEAISPEGVYEVEESAKGFACGIGALAAMLWAALDLGADSVRILHHATSGDVTGDYSSVVGYGAAVVLRTGQGNVLQS